MIRIDDYNASVFEIQSALRALSTDNPAIRPRLIPDGVFGAETDAAVRSFQAFRRLPETGIVNFETWTALFPVVFPPLECVCDPVTAKNEQNVN